MKIKELIEILNRYNPDFDVVIDNFGVNGVLKYGGHAVTIESEDLNNYYKQFRELEENYEELQRDYDRLDQDYLDLENEYENYTDSY